MKSEKMLSTSCAITIANGALMFVLPGAPIWMFGLATEPNDSSPKMSADTQKTGDLS